MVIQLCPAVGTVDQPGQGIGLADGVVAAGCLSQLLGQLPDLLVYDSLVGVFKNQPILRGMVNRLLIFVGFLVRAEVDRMPHILRLGQYLPYDKVAPCIGTVNIFLAFPDAPALSCQVSRRKLNLVPIQNIRNIAQAVSLDS